MRVFKYQLTQRQTTQVELPQGAEILRVAVQSKDVFLWAMVDPDEIKEVRTIEVFCTGDLMPNFNRRFINTFFANDGDYVYHAFERI